MVRLPERLARAIEHAFATPFLGAHERCNVLPLKRAAGVPARRCRSARK